MANLLHNISGEITQELLAAGNSLTINSVSIVSTNANISVLVDLYIEKVGTGKYYVIKNHFLNVGEKLETGLGFNNGPNQFGLFVKLTNVFSSGTPTVDIILK